MLIMCAERNVAPVFSLDEGDIFKYTDDYYDDYYIAGEINMPDSCRECFNLSKNYAFKMRLNPVVEYWHGENVKLLLSDRSVENGK